MPFRQLLTDKVTLVKKDGTFVRKDIAASVQSDQIFIFEPKLPIDVGDHLLRERPGGLVDDFIVDDPAFMSGIQGGSPPHFQTKVRRSNRPAGPSQTIINNIVGDNARVNINSIDNSTNIVTSNSETLFKDMLKAVEKIEDKSQRELLAATISAMAAAHRRQDGTFLSKYKEFVTSAANHMTIFAPFLPAITNLLSP